ncbi:hypothetical protein AVEN_42173-1 [Araneus ventricosus]|uniref:Uncharacterized protein n=1 Tax=Araneus ventricosus TaxID=182803 RepID=A0A4Y2B0T7_ARAVE|nr:hypothetical protein AVEN_42173-1 [Araneus ventricosus]
MGVKVENDIDELEEDHNQELTTEELTELHCVSQQEVAEESLSEEEGRKKFPPPPPRIYTCRISVFMIQKSKWSGWISKLSTTPLESSSVFIIDDRFWLGVER